MTRQQRLNLSFFIGMWSTCQDKDNHWTREVFAGIWRKYGGRNAMNADQFVAANRSRVNTVEIGELVREAFRAGAAESPLVDRRPWVLVNEHGREISISVSAGIHVEIIGADSKTTLDLTPMGAARLKTALDEFLLGGPA